MAHLHDHHGSAGLGPPSEFLKCSEVTPRVQDYVARLLQKASFDHHVARDQKARAAIRPPFV
jgi:hypothetical protein